MPPTEMRGEPRALATVTNAFVPGLGDDVVVTDRMNGLSRMNVKTGPVSESPLLMFTTDVGPGMFEQPLMAGAPVMAMSLVPETNTGWAAMPPMVTDPPPVSQQFQ